MSSTTSNGQPIPVSVAAVAVVGITAQREKHEPDELYLQS